MANIPFLNNAYFAAKVGIGTASPQTTLHLYDTGGSILRLSSDAHTDNNKIEFDAVNGGTIYHSIVSNTNSGNLQIRAGDGGSGHEVNIYTDGSFAATFDSSQRLGVGTLAPGAKLTVAGDVLINSGEYISWGTVGATSIEGSTASNKLQFRTNSSDRMIIDSSGNVGIGTTSPTEKLHVDGNARVTGAYYDSGNLPGTTTQLLSSTVTGTAWIDPSTIVAEAATLVVIACKNTSGATIAQGTPVYQTGTVGATATIEIAPADALISANKLPAIGLLQTALNNNGFGFVVITGELTNFTTSPIDGVTPTTGDKVFVKSGGGLTLTKPTGEGNGIQNMGLVGKVSSGNSGSITVSSIMRTNDVPNLPEGRIWVGDGNTIVSDTVYVDEPNNRVGIGTTSPSYKLTSYSSGDEFAIVAGAGNAVGEFTGIGLSGYIATNAAVKAGLVFERETSWGIGKMHFLNNNTLGDSDATLSDSKMTIDSTGNVGIGTTSPASKFEVYGGSSGVNDVDRYVRFKASNGEKRFDFYVGGTGNASSLGMYNSDGTTKNVQIAAGGTSYLNGGNVGIGTTSPTGAKLVIDSSTAPQILVKNSSGANSQILFEDSSGGVQNASITYDQGGHNALYITTSYDSPSDLNRIYLQPGGETAMTLRGGNDATGQAGFVGIGTITPTSQLHVSGASVSGEPLVHIQNASGTAALSYGLLVQGGGNSASGYEFFTKDESGNIDFAIKGDGNVGIGTTSPAKKLDVVSNTTYDGIQISGSSIPTLGIIDTTNNAKFVAYVRDSDATIGMETNHPLTINTNNTERMRITSAGAIKFNAYDSTNQTGTPTYLLGTDASGNVVKTNTIPGSAAGPYVTIGTAQTITGVKTFANVGYLGDGTGSVQYTLQSSNTGYGTIDFGDVADSNIGRLSYNHNDNSFLIRTNNATALTLDASQNATFAGAGAFAGKLGVGVAAPHGSYDFYNQGTAYFNGAVTVDDAFTQSGGLASTFSGTVTIPEYIYHTADSNTKFGFSSNDNFNIIAGGNANFAVNGTTAYLKHTGNTKLITTSTGVTVTGTATATTFLGDLNGTINTVTTAVTKANATNDTTVATTAFVQNLIGTIPAGLVFQGTWNAATNTPTLTSGSGTTGHFYIVSVDGSTNLDGITDWKVGDWAVFVEQGASDQWEKVDNSSVLDGSGTGQKVTKWDGSGTSNTLTDGPITFSTNDSTFAGSVTVGTKLMITSSSDYIDVISDDLYIVAADKNILYSGNAETLRLDESQNATFVGDVNITQTTDVGVLNTTNLDNGSAVGLSLTYPTSNVAAGDGLAIAIGITGRGRSYIANRNATNNLDASNLVFYTENGGVIGERMTIREDGNVGIGTSTPSEKLEVDGIIKVVHTDNSYANYRGQGVFFNRTENYVAPLADNTSTLNIGYNGAKWGNIEINGAFIKFENGPNEFMRIASSGNVGIGTTSPSTKFQISGGNSGTPATALFSIQKNEEGYGLFSGVLGSGVSWMQSATKTQSAYYGLSLQPNGGNVGIGTTSPVSTLQIAATTTEQTTAELTDAGSRKGLLTLSGLSNQVAGAGGGVVFAGNSTTSYAAIKGLLNNGGGNTQGSIAFSTRALQTDTALTERMRVHTNGNVGVGAADPKSKLQVAGGIQMADDTDTASADKVGTMRYRESGGVSYADMVMKIQGGYAWVNIVQNIFTTP